MTWVLAMILGYYIQAQATNIDKWDYITLKSFCIAKVIINRVKRPYI